MTLGASIVASNIMALKIRQLFRENVGGGSRAARDFYLRFGFSPSPVDELRLMLLMKDLRAFLRARR